MTILIGLKKGRSWYLPFFKYAKRLACLLQAGAMRIAKRWPMKTRLGIIGATGYTGLELLRLLLLHPEVEVTALTSQKYAGIPIDQVFPSLMKHLQLKCEELSIEQISKKTDFIFTAVPHKTAMETIPPFYKEGKRVVDLSADFRLKILRFMSIGIRNIPVLNCFLNRSMAYLNFTGMRFGMQKLWATQGVTPLEL